MPGSDDPLPTATVHRILVVEDDAETSAMLRRDLEESGFDVTVATDGGQAQASFVMRQPDLVILDLILPGESGFEICERLKQVNDSVPIVVVSEIGIDDSHALAEKVGADAYIEKPWIRSDIVRTIDEVAESVFRERINKRPRTLDRVKFGCSTCGKKFKVSASHRGKSLTCPKCGEPVHVPRHD